MQRTVRRRHNTKVGEPIQKGTVGEFFLDLLSFVTVCAASQIPWVLGIDPPWATILSLVTILYGFAYLSRHNKERMERIVKDLQPKLDGRLLDWYIKWNQAGKQDAPSALPDDKKEMKND